MKSLFRFMHKAKLTAIALLSLSATVSQAQAVDPPSSFTLIGHIEKFTLDFPTVQTSSALVTVRGIDVVLPNNLIITMPGGYLTAEQLFRGRDFKPTYPDSPPRTGLALQDLKAADLGINCAPGVTAAGNTCPLPVAEIELAGNIIGGRYIAGLARISQGGLHVGGGFIRTINPATGFFTVGTDIAGGQEARLRLNDPEGIYGPKPAAGVVDQRFALDPGNSPIHAKTGFPVCLPDSTRPGLCPSSNRPAATLKRFTCGASPAGVTEPAVAGCQPHLPIPLQVGDYVNYVGMLDKDVSGYFISLHGLEAELGVYTSPGLDPAYTFIEEAIQGTKGALYPLDANGPIPQEETTRYKIVGFTTDPSRTITVEIFDDASNKNPQPTTPGPGPLATKIVANNVLATKIIPLNGAQMGRFRMIWAAKEDARIVRRNVRVILSPATVPSNPAFAPGSGSKDMPAPFLPAGASARGGYAFGQFEAPVNEYISPEITRYGVKGWPVPVNFEDFCFLRLSNTFDTQEPNLANAAKYVPVTLTAATPSPINPLRPRSQAKFDGTRVCGD